MLRPLQTEANPLTVQAEAGTSEVEGVRVISIEEATPRVGQWLGGGLEEKGGQTAFGNVDCPFRFQRHS